MDGHTRGPYRIDLNRGRIRGAAIRAADDTLIATLPEGTSTPEGEIIGTAKLLRAAPDLGEIAARLDRIRAFFHAAMNVPVTCAHAGADTAPMCGNTACAELGCMVALRDDAKAALDSAYNGDPI